MTPHERDIMREIKPLVDRGVRGRTLRIYQNLTTWRRKLPKCKCGCGEALISLKHHKTNAKFATRLCFQRWKRNQSMEKLLAASIIMCLCALSYSADLFVVWTNGDNGTNAIQTIVRYGTAPGSCTNATGFVVVPFSQTNVWLTNLIAGQRYWVTAAHSDGTDVSPCSNEANAKTRMNPPKNLGVNSP